MVFSSVLSPSTVRSGHQVQVTRLALQVLVLVEPSHWPRKVFRFIFSIFPTRKKKSQLLVLPFAIF